MQTEKNVRIGLITYLHCIIHRFRSPRSRTYILLYIATSLTSDRREPVTQLPAHARIIFQIQG